MMDFILSRVTVSICALILLATLAPILDSHNQQRLDSEATYLAESIDSLLYSVARTEAEIWVDGSDILPRGWTATISPGVIVLENGDREFVRALETPYEGRTLQLGHDSLILISSSRNDGITAVHLQNVDTMSSKASPSLETSLWSL